MISTGKITKIYFIIDEFHKEFEKAKQGHILDCDTTLKRRNRKQKLSDSEVICIMTLFHCGNFITNLLSGMIAYSFFDKNPSLNIEIIDNRISA